MALNSMTGFARAEGAFGSTNWVWEIRSVNGKGLDVRLRLPNGHDGLDTPARTRLTKSFSRGNLQVSLQMQKTDGNLKPKVNHALANEYIDLAKQFAKQIDGSLPTPAELMSMRGVVELEEEALSEEEQQSFHNEILASLDRAIAALADARAKEGASVGQVLQQQLAQLASLLGNIAKNPDRSAENIKATLAQQIAKLNENADGFDSQRLHQEAVLLAAKADIQEELDRLNVHLNSAGDLLKEGGPVGRKLDFLAQEFNRECNTICSKSNSASVTSSGLDMKLVIDQFREQVQNME